MSGDGILGPGGGLEKCQWNFFNFFNFAFNVFGSRQLWLTSRWGFERLSFQYINLQSIYSGKTHKNKYFWKQNVTEKCHVVFELTLIILFTVYHSNEDYFYVFLP